MPSTFTANKGFETQATGENAGLWGANLNNNFISLVDVALGGQTSLTLSNANVTLSAAQARNVSLRLNGALTANIIITNANKGFYVAENLTSGAFTVTVTNGVAGVVLAQNFRYVLFADGTNGVRVIGTAGANNPVAFPVGTQMLFAQAAVPTGWTLSSALNDYAIKVGSTGGATSGSIAFSTVFNLTQTDLHTLTSAEMPAHNHTYTAPLQGSTSGSAAANWAARDGAGENSGNLSVAWTSSGGGGGHNHTADLRIRRMTTIIGVRAA